MSLYKVLGVEVEMDFLDADFVEKYENAYEKMEKDARNIDPTLKTSERIRKQCGVMKQFIVDIFGEEVHDKMFGDKQSISLYVQASSDIYDARIQEDIHYKQLHNKFYVNRDMAGYNSFHHGKGKRRHK